MRLGARRRDHPDERLDRRAQHRPGAQMLTRQDDQTRRGVVLDGSLKQPPCETLTLAVVRPTPTEMRHHEPEVVTPGLGPCPIRQQLMWGSVDLAARNVNASSGIEATSSGTNPRNCSADSDTASPRRFSEPR
jgi:hypothetical protein